MDEDEQPIEPEQAELTRLRERIQLLEQAEAARAQAEEALARSEERLRLALEAAGMGTWDWDIDRGEVAWTRNPKGGWAPPAGVFTEGYPAFRQWVHPADREAVDAAVTKAAATRTEFTQEFRVVLPDGQICWVLTLGRFFYDAAGRATRMVGIHTDVTARKQADSDTAQLYEEAQEAIRARDEFLSVAAHELKTPVTSLRGYAQLLLRQLERPGQMDPGKAQRALQTIDEQSDKLTHLITQLLDVSRLQAGRLVLDRQVTDVTGLVQNVVAGIQTTTTRHTIEVQAPPWTWMLVDPFRIEQVVTNLVDNAVKYSPDGGTIEIEIALPDAHSVEIAVTDHGIGIPPEQREYIFDRFYQGQRLGYLGGMGLGLYVSRQIVELHGGQARAEFPPGGGTRICVILPTGLGGDPAADPPAPV